MQVYEDEKTDNLETIHMDKGKGCKPTENT